MNEFIADIARALIFCAAFFLPSIIAGRRKVYGQGAVLALTLMVITWPWAIALAFSPITKTDFPDQTAP